MAQTLIRILAAWSLVGPPVLCRAGVLVDCCDDEQAAQAVSASQPPCCAGDPCTAEPQTPEPTPRKCSECAAVCSTPAKPPDETTSTHAITHVVAVSDTARDADAAERSVDPTKPPPRPNLPFPPSDRPLLI